MCDSAMGYYRGAGVAETQSKIGNSVFERCFQTLGLGDVKMKCVCTRKPDSTLSVGNGLLLESWQGGSRASSLPIADASDHSLSSFRLMTPAAALRR